MDGWDLASGVSAGWLSVGTVCVLACLLDKGLEREIAGRIIYCNSRNLSALSLRHMVEKSLQCM